MKKLLLVTSLNIFLSANAHSGTNTCPEGQILGAFTHECVSQSGECGNGCTYTLNESGVLTYTTTSSGLSGGNVSAIPEDVRKNVKDLDFNVKDNQLDYMNGYLFEFDSYPNLRPDFILPNNIFKKGAWIEVSNSFPSGTSRLSQDHLPSPFVLPENISYTMSYNRPLGSTDGFTVYCTGKQIESGGCLSNATHYEHEGDNYLVYDQNGNITGIYADLPNMTQDKVIDHPYQKTENGRIINYDGHGNIINSYTNNADGSVSYYDSKGNLQTIRGKKIYTIEEAEAVTAHGEKFRVGLTYK